MAGIAGLAKQDSYSEVAYMLDRIAHRGRMRRKIFEAEGTTMGVVWNETGNDTFSESAGMSFVRDIAGPGHYATVMADNGTFIFSRDGLGVAPLYKGTCSDGTTCFASEVKALIPGVSGIEEVTPGNGDNEQLTSLSSDKKPVATDPEVISSELRTLLDDAVSSTIRDEETGAWLSGGLDSAAVSALASKYTGRLKTFTAGLEGSPDLECAAQTAKHLGSEHHEVVVTLDDLVAVLPDVIWHLESFDPLLVRSSVLNFIVSRMASDYVSEIFSGEGADELFAGYSYLLDLPGESLPDELVRITGKLHNTALQRVDRCANAYGTTAHVVFTYPDVVNYALAIPPEFKIVNGVEKWILRQAVDDLLPHKIAWRRKAKFWEGGGVKEKLAEVAEKSISDNDFRNERLLPNGWVLTGREELWYYRIFREYFGNDITLSWMGRSDVAHAET
jgi:asparagine synthase (glutamine-hydrolysing)